MRDDLIVGLYDAYQYLRVSNAYNVLIEKFRSNTKEYKDNYYKLKNRRVSENSKTSIYLTLVTPALLFIVCIFAVEEIIGKLFSLLCLVGVILYGFLYSKSNKNKSTKFNNKLKKEAEDYWQKIGGPAEAKNIQEINKIEKERDKFLRENAEVIEIVPYEYRLESTVGYLLTVILNKRADNLKEAINLYEEELHRAKMENAINGLMQMVDSINYDIHSQMSQISSSLEITNSKLKNIENLEFYQAFIKK